jgi:hypothetical protein
MEGGSPELIWRRWTLPMYFAQQRYWKDHPPLQRIAMSYFKIKPRKTSKPKTGITERPSWEK